MRRKRKYATGGLTQALVGYAPTMSTPLTAADEDPASGNTRKYVPMDPGTDYYHYGEGPEHTFFTGDIKGAPIKPSTGFNDPTTQGPSTQSNKPGFGDYLAAIPTLGKTASLLGQVAQGAGFDNALTQGMVKYGDMASGKGALSGVLGNSGLAPVQTTVSPISMSDVLGTGAAGAGALPSMGAGAASGAAAAGDAAAGLGAGALGSSGLVGAGAGAGAASIGTGASAGSIAGAGGAGAGAGAGSLGYGPAAIVAIGPIMQSLMGDNKKHAISQMQARAAQEWMDSQGITSVQKPTGQGSPFGIPTTQTVYMRNGKPFDYTAPENRDAFMAWAKERGYDLGLAHGGQIGQVLNSPGPESAHKTSEFYVKGPGTGRSDDIPARLSDGEYVMDAETVALLGDGSSDAGARRLDEMRTNLCKHKGKKLSKGQFSANAKPAASYLKGKKA